MPERELTLREKNEIRNSPCRCCGRKPPFEDGSRCHVHRKIRGRDGGMYTKSNTEPRCRWCHSAAHPELAAFMKDHAAACRAGGLIGGPKGGFATMSIEKRREVGRLVPMAQRVKNGKKSMAALSPEQRVKLARKGQSARTKESLRASMRGMKRALAERGVTLTGRAAIEAAKTHCKHGHPFDEANTYRYLTPRGTPGRMCRACARRRQSARYDAAKDDGGNLNRTEASRAAKRRYKQRHREKVNTAERKRRARTAEHRRELDRARYWCDPEKQRKRQRDWIAKKRSEQRSKH